MSKFYERKENIRGITISDKVLNCNYIYNPKSNNTISFWDALFFRKPTVIEEGFYYSNIRFTREQILNMKDGETTVYIIVDNKVYTKPSYRINIEDGSRRMDIYDYFDTFEDVEKFVNEFIKVNGLGEDFIIID